MANILCGIRTTSKTGEACIKVINHNRKFANFSTKDLRSKRRILFKIVKPSYVFVHF